jgi:hypothetical protein
MEENGKKLFAGLSGVELDVDAFDLGSGVVIRRAQAQVASFSIVSFSPDGLKGVMDSVWQQPSQGGLSFDIKVELQVPDRPLIDETISSRETIWWIVALLRLFRYPFASIPMISNHPYYEASDAALKPSIELVEIEPRVLKADSAEASTITKEILIWVRDNWQESGKLLTTNAEFSAAMKAFDYATVRGRQSSAMLAVWAALEQIFSPSPGELRFRVSAFMASYLEEPGEKRSAKFKEIMALYKERSTAAHTTRAIEPKSLLGSYVLLRNVLTKIISAGKVPNQDELEGLLFGNE